MYCGPNFFFFFLNYIYASCPSIYHQPFPQIWLICSPISFFFFFLLFYSIFFFFFFVSNWSLLIRKKKFTTFFIFLQTTKVKTYKKKKVKELKGSWIQFMVETYLKFNILRVSLHPNVVELGRLFHKISWGARKLTWTLMSIKKKEWGI